MHKIWHFKLIYILEIENCISWTICMLKRFSPASTKPQRLTRGAGARLAHRHVQLTRGRGHAMTWPEHAPCARCEVPVVRRASQLSRGEKMCTWVLHRSSLEHQRTVGMAEGDHRHWSRGGVGAPRRRWPSGRRWGSATIWRLRRSQGKAPRAPYQLVACMTTTNQQGRAWWLHWQWWLSEGGAGKVFDKGVTA